MGVNRGEPIWRRKCDAPNISGHFHFDANLKKFANSSRALNPGYTSTRGARRLRGIVVRHLKRDPHIFQHVMFGLVAATMTANQKSGSAFLKGTAKRVNAGDGERHGLHDARATASAKIGIVVRR